MHESFHLCLKIHAWIFQDYVVNYIFIYVYINVYIYIYIKDSCMNLFNYALNYVLERSNVKLIRPGGMREAIKSASSSLRMAGVWDYTLDSYLNPRVSFMLSPPFRWTPALRRPEQNFWKLSWPCSKLAPKSPKISKNLKNWTFEFQLKFWIDFWTHLFKFDLILELEISQELIKNQTLNKKWQNRKAYENHSFYNGFWRYGSEQTLNNQHFQSKHRLRNHSKFL